MRIHTRATRQDAHTAARRAGVLAHVTEHASRTHEHALEVTLEGSAAHMARAGTADFHAGTWDEWGIFLAALYEVDPGARCGGTVKRPFYADADTFHMLTGWRFESLTPGEQHARHRWDWAGVPRELECKCGAVRRWAA